MCVCVFLLLHCLIEYFHPRTTRTSRCNTYIFILNVLYIQVNREMVQEDTRQEGNGSKTISGYTLQSVIMLCDDYASCTACISSRCSPPGIQFEIRKTENKNAGGEKKTLSIFLLSQNGLSCAVMVQLSNSHTSHNIKSHI